MTKLPLFSIFYFFFHWKLFGPFPEIVVANFVSPFFYSAQASIHESESLYPFQILCHSPLSKLYSDLNAFKLFKLLLLLILVRTLAASFEVFVTVIRDKTSLQMLCKNGDFFYYVPTISIIFLVLRQVCLRYVMLMGVLLKCAA